MWTLAALVAVFELKHLLCDFFLQGEYMLGKSRREGWFSPLLAHGMVHAAGTGTILAAASYLHGPGPLWLAALPAVDLVLHTAMDRVKASPDLLGRWLPVDREFWWALGVDQTFHHLTHLGLALVLATQW